MRLKVKILVLVSKHETDEKKSRSRLETWDCKIKFSFSSRSTRPRDRNSRSRLEAWDWKEEILDLVSKHETERKKFSISSRELKRASRYALVSTALIARKRCKGWRVVFAHTCKALLSTCLPVRRCRWRRYSYVAVGDEGAMVGRFALRNPTPVPSSVNTARVTDDPTT